MSKKIMCSFADRRMKYSLRRLASQAQALNFFDDIKIYDETALDRSFQKRFAFLLKAGVRGFGYWVWKPEIIRQMLLSMKDGDILFYLDAGCHLNPKGVDRLEAYCSKLMDSDFFILATELEDEYLERFWTKGSLFDYFNARHDLRISDTPQIQAGVIVIKKTSQALHFVEEWLRVFEMSTALVDDSVSTSPNFEGFKEHRHDQSVFSILCKRTGVILIPNSEIYRYGDWSKMESYPIWAMRDKKVHQTLARRIADRLRKKLFSK